MEAVLALSPRIGIQSACRSLGLPRATFYRQRPLLGPSSDVVPVDPPAARPRPARALNEEEQQQVLSVLHSERFENAAPAAIHAQLLDEGRYLCSPRTMYRLLAQRGESRERRDQLIHPP